ncbi:centrosomal protein of 131 kDa [Labeo rohita]|uniref:Centrosomal protein of 131 kDa n=1 Tax=Labeo rohita TaxID=84645 RepID=A0A498MTU2_LABRO|nr:centrosomal protein of 131 kDa [Labeo rohita]
MRRCCAVELETDEKSLSDAPNGNNDALIWLKTVSSSNVDNLEKVKMHTTRSPSASIQTGAVGDVLDLSLSGSQLTMGRRPSSASPGKHFSRSISVSVASDGRGKRNTLTDAGLGSSRAIKNLRRSNSTTQVNQQANTSPSEGQTEDFLALFNSSSDGRRKLASLSKTSKDRTTWNILDDQPRAFPVPSSSHSTCSMDSPTGLKKREAGVSLAANFTANNRSNKAAVGNSVTPILHNNHSEKPLTPKSSNQKPSFNNIIKATVNDDVTLDVSCSLTKSQKNFSSASSSSNNNAPRSPRSPGQPRRREVTEEEAERYIQQVNHAAITIQRWYRRHVNRKRANENTIKHLLTSKKKEREQRAEEEKTAESLKKKDDDRKRIREEKARLARLTAIQELQQKRAQRAAEVQQIAEVEVEALRHAAKVGRKKLTKSSPTSPTDVKAKNTDSNVNVVPDLDDVTNLRAASPAGSVCRGSQCSQEILQRSVSMEDQRQGASSSRAQSKTTLNDLLDTLKLLEEEPERLPEPKSYRKDKYSWIDEDGDSNSLTTDNVERHRQLSQAPALPDGGALLSEAKLQSIMSFLDEMEKSEQERPRSVTSGSHREVVLSEEDLAVVEQASATAAEVTGSMMRLKLELDEKKRTVNMLQTALTQQRELTIRHVKETEKELNHTFQLQKQQYEATIQRHLTFIDQEIKKLKELMSATEKIRREKWIDEKTKKIKEITVKGLSQKKKNNIFDPKPLNGQLSSHLLRISYTLFEKQLQEEENALQQQRRRLYKEVSEEKERITQLAARQHAELEDLRKQLEENSSLAARALREELEKNREEQERRHQVEIKALKERLEIEKQTWEENYMKKEEAWLLSRERELKEEVRRGRDKEIELAIQRLEEETRGAREECEIAADNRWTVFFFQLNVNLYGMCTRVCRMKRVREKYEAELRDLERSERTALQKQQEMREKHSEMEAELLRLQSLLRQREQEISDLTQARDKLSDERRSLAEVIRQEFAERLVETEEENKRMKMEVSEAKARLRLEVERVTREKEEELAEVHQRVKSAILKKEETVNNLRKQHENCPSNIRKRVPQTQFAQMFLHSIPVLQWAKHFTPEEYERLSHYSGAHGWGSVGAEVLKSSLGILNTSANQLMFDDWERRANRSECIRCAVVGNGGILNGSRKGKEIDEHDYVFRVNGAVLKGFEKDVGSRTSFYTFSTNTMRNSMRSYAGVGYRGPPISKVTIVVCPPTYFGKNVTAEKFKIYHPDFIRYLRNRFLHSHLLKTGARRIYRPSTGAVMLLAAIHTCDQVDAYGFMTPDYTLYSDHYYDKQRRTVHFYANHDMRMELKLWQKLHEAGLMNLFMR